MNQDFTNKVVIVTGSSAGIGLAMARAFAENGASVILNGRDLEKLEAAYSQFEKYGDRVRPLSGDAASEIDIARIVKIAKQRFGRIDVLINNAAITKVGAAVKDLSVEDWDAVLNQNLRGAFLFSKAVIPHFVEQKSGRIINIGALSSKNPLPFAAADAAAKAGLLALTRVLAVELGQYNVTVNAIIPGYQPETEIGKQFNDKLAAAFHAAPESMEAAMKARTLLRRFETMDEIAATALFLASDAGAAMTGQNLNVNCGLATY